MEKAVFLQIAMVECSHVAEAVSLTVEQVKNIQPQHWACAVCRSRKSPWICLKCGAVHCGRYVNGHAKKHAELSPGHCLCMDQRLTVYCYEDDDFVVNDNQVVRDMRVEIEHKMSERSRSSSNSDSSDKDELSPPPKMIKLSNGHQFPVRTAGLLNLGNTCFMNSILQSLGNLEQFCCYFKKLPSLEPLEGKCNHKYHTRRSNSDVSLVEEIRKVSCALWEETTVHSPDSLFSVIWKLVPRFRGYQQQDAHEFMRYLLDKLHSELAESANMSNRKPTIVSQIFGGILQSDVTCLECHTESRKLDPILDVSLDIPEQFTSRKRAGPICSLSDCLVSFTDLETLQETEWYYCVRCRRRQPSTKQLSLHTLPNVLCLHLKRFRFNSFLRTKLTTQIGFPLQNLDMSPYTSDYDGSSKKACLYDLAALVVHHGSGVSSGHYTAYAYSPDAGSWYHFNDSTVNETESEWVAACKAYILFYVRRDSNGKYSTNSSKKCVNN